MDDFDQDIESLTTTIPLTALEVRDICGALHETVARAEMRGEETEEYRRLIVIAIKLNECVIKRFEERVLELESDTKLN